MKKVVLLTILTLFAFSSYSQTKDEINYIQSIWGIEKREIVKKYMNLDESESKDFWIVYDKYEVSRKELGEERIKTIADYSQNVGTLTDENAEELVKKMLANQTKFLELLSITFYQMRTVLTQLKAVQFIRLENYLDTEIKLRVMDEIPLIGEIKK